MKIAFFECSIADFQWGYKAKSLPFPFYPLIPLTSRPLSSYARKGPYTANRPGQLSWAVISFVRLLCQSAFACTAWIAYFMPSHMKKLSASLMINMCAWCSGSPLPLLHQQIVRHMDQLDAVVVAFRQVVHRHHILVVVIPDLHEIGGLPLGLIGQAVADLGVDPLAPFSAYIPKNFVDCNSFFFYRRKQIWTRFSIYLFL